MTIQPTTPELLSQFGELTRRIELSEERLRAILKSLTEDSYVSVGGVLPIEDPGILDREIDNITMVNHRERDPSLQRRKFGDYIIGPHAVTRDDGSIVYYPLGRMVYVPQATLDMVETEVEPSN